MQSPMRPRVERARAIDSMNARSHMHFGDKTTTIRIHVLRDATGGFEDERLAIRARFFGGFPSPCCFAALALPSLPSFFLAFIISIQ